MPLGAIDFSGFAELAGGFKTKQDEAYDERFKGEDYGFLMDEFRRIYEEGILSSKDMETLIGHYRSIMEPQIARQRARASADVGRRMGARSGASRKAIFNLVDVPAQRREREFMSDLQRRNMMSRMPGLTGLTDLYGKTIGIEQFKEKMRLGWAEHERAEKADEGGGFLDFVGDLFTGAAGYFGAGGSGKSSGGTVSEAYPEGPWG